LTGRFQPFSGRKQENRPAHTQSAAMKNKSPLARALGESIYNLRQQGVDRRTETVFHLVAVSSHYVGCRRLSSKGRHQQSHNQQYFFHSSLLLYLFSYKTAKSDIQVLPPQSQQEATIAALRKNRVAPPRNSPHTQTMIDPLSSTP
jgi:hypothetical protein